MSVARCCCNVVVEPIFADNWPTAEFPSPGPTTDYDATQYGWYYKNDTFITQDPSSVYIGTTGTGVTAITMGGYWLFENIAHAQGTQIWSAELYIDSAQIQTAGPFPCTSPLSTPESKTFSTFGCVFGTTARAIAYAEDIDHATEYATVAQINAASRTVGQANEYSVATNGSANGAWMKQFEQRVLSDVTAQVQQVLDRPGWGSGNDMQFFVEDNGSDRLYDADPSVGYNTYIALRDSFNLPPTVKLRITESA